VRTCVRVRVYVCVCGCMCACVCVCVRAQTFNQYTYISMDTHLNTYHHTHVGTGISGHAAKEWLTSRDMQELVAAFETEGYGMEAIRLANRNSADLLDSLGVPKGGHKLKVSAHLICVTCSVCAYMGTVYIVAKSKF